MRNLKAVAGLTAALALLVSLPLAAQQHKMMEAKEVTVTGRVVDAACFIKAGLKAEGHRACAIACAKGGQNLAILDEEAGKLYLTLAPKPGGAPDAQLVDLAEKVVEVKGTLHEFGGVSGIVVASVKEVS